VDRLSASGLRTIVIALVLALVGCDQDPFGNSYRGIAGPYYLLRWEDGKTFYITSSRAAENIGGGVVGGTVDPIGWSGDRILAKRIAMFRGDGDGWMLIDVKQQTVRGPFSDAQLSTLVEAKGIRPLAAATAWNKLN
jgi:hypothetical protein